ncbi:hypothetical protein M0R04_15485 [Candidatus Dojkabacteria bacterium]|jgi:hypothetical protein|nr:hypothetical protein [Candidatus Dojkabacteria bacterium]
MKIKKIKYIDSARTPDQDSLICEPFIIVVVGFVIKETDKYITLAQEIMSNGDFRGQISIPKVTIIK